MVQGAVGNGNAILCVVLIIENILGKKYCEKKYISCCLDGL